MVLAFAVELGAGTVKIMTSDVPSKIEHSKSWQIADRPPALVVNAVTGDTEVCSTGGRIGPLFGPSSSVSRI